MRASVEVPCQAILEECIDCDGTGSLCTEGRACYWCDGEGVIVCSGILDVRYDTLDGEQDGASTVCPVCQRIVPQHAITAALAAERL